MIKDKRIESRRKKERRAQERSTFIRRNATENRCPDKVEPHHGGRIPKEGLKKIKKAQGL